MSIPNLHDPAAAQRYLLQFDAATVRLGRTYVKQSQVHRSSWNAEGTEYNGGVFDGQLFVCSLTYREGEWLDSCSCWAGGHCAHTYGLMWQLFEGVNSPAEEPRGSLLRQSLHAALKRPLSSSEDAYLKTIEQMYGSFSATGRLSAWQLHSFTGSYGSSWEYVDIFQTLPTSIIEFWRGILCYLREREVQIPEFMLKIFTTEEIDAQIAVAKRRRQVDKWHQRLDSNPGLSALDFPPVDLRLAITPTELIVEWREDRTDWRPIRKSDARLLLSREKDHALAMVPEAFLIWQSLFPNEWMTDAQCRFPISERTLPPAMGRLVEKFLRLSSLADRIVNEHGQPFIHAPEPLCWKLDSPPDPEGDYRLQLALPDQTIPPPPLVILPGPPPLWVSETTVYQCPRVHPDDSFAMTGVEIPAPALQSRNGLRFLLRVAAPISPELETRVQRSSLKVRIQCAIEPVYEGASTEVCWIKVNAISDQDSRMEKLHPDGWVLQPSSQDQTKDTGIVVHHDRSRLAAFPSALKGINAQWDERFDQWRVRVGKQFAEPFLAWLDSLPADVEVMLDEQLRTLREGAVSGSIKLNCVETTVDWFDLSVVLNVSDLELTPPEIKLLLNARGRFVRLGKKGWRRLSFDISPAEDEALARLGLAASDFSSEPQRLHALQLADPAASQFLPAEQVQAVRRRAQEIQTRVSPAVPSEITAQLRPYQIEGFHFLAYLTTNHFGGILADDMGLGKTVQTLTWLAWLRGLSTGPAKANLIVCPKSVMDNWQTEAARFYPRLRVYLHRNTAARPWKKILKDHDMVIVNYAQLRALSEDLTRISFGAVVLDEGQYIKNPSSQTAQVARSLKADYRLALSGTPIENRLLDLWSLMSFAMPGVLGTRAQFARDFDRKGDPNARRRLAARVRPFVLRRTKNQVAKELPARVEEDLLCHIEGNQETLYRAELKRAQQMLLGIKTARQLAEEKFNFLSSLLRLRQICCHPALVDSNFTDAESAKMTALMDLLEPLMEEGHKVLVFSQFVSLLDIVRPALEARNWPIFYLSGATEERGALVEKFQTFVGEAIFLISLKAGGFGLNLTAASYVVLFDPWWNPAVESQAIDRTHRIGQVNKVIAYRLLIKNSIEEKIRELQRKKSSLAQDVLGEENFMSSLSLDDFKFLFSDEGVSEERVIRNP